VVVVLVIAASLSACDLLPAAPAKPKPGATLVGTIVTDRAKSAQISLKISDDGQTIEEVWVTFTELEFDVSESGSSACASWHWGNVTYTDLDCRGFSAGSLSTLVGVDVSITDGKFEVKSRSIGEIRGQFTSPTAVRGVIHLAFFDGKVECGTLVWSAS
jgi:hypothetical protein